MSTPVVLVTGAVTGIGRATALALRGRRPWRRQNSVCASMSLLLDHRYRDADPLYRDCRTESGLVAGVPLQRMGRPEEIAQMNVFLASDKASFSTDATFAADGGKTAR
jgi:NAD(P)-dependent dehydrogenase (short-subunit alcohol dehydrogenase family)